MKEQMEEVRVWKKSRSPGGGDWGEKRPNLPLPVSLLRRGTAEGTASCLFFDTARGGKGPVTEGERQVVDSLGSQGGTEPVRAQEQIQRIIDIGAEKIGGG